MIFTMGGSPTCFLECSLAVRLLFQLLPPRASFTQSHYPTDFDTKHHPGSHPAATVHQHNPAPQLLHFQPVFLIRQVNSSYFIPISLLFSTLANNTQPYPDQPHSLTGTHIVIKAASCKITSLHPQAVTHENRMVACSPHTSGLQSEQSIRKKIFCSFAPLQPCYLTLEKRKFNS